MPKDWKNSPVTGLLPDEVPYGDPAATPLTAQELERMETATESAAAAASAAVSVAQGFSGRVSSTESRLDTAEATLAGKADIGHSHVIADTDGLQAALDGKSPTSHKHPGSDITGVVKTVNGSAPDAAGDLSIPVVVGGAPRGSLLVSDGQGWKAVSPSLDGTIPVMNGAAPYGLEFIDPSSAILGLPASGYAVTGQPAPSGTPTSDSATGRWVPSTVKIARVNDAAYIIAAGAFITTVDVASPSLSSASSLNGVVVAIVPPALRPSVQVEGPLIPIRRSTGSDQVLKSVVTTAGQVTISGNSTSFTSAPSVDAAGHYVYPAGQRLWDLTR